MELIVLQSEAYKELQKAMFAHMKELFEEERKKSYIEWLDSSQAAELLKVSKRTLQSWRDEGLLGHSKVGGRVLFNREEIDLMLMRHHNKAFRTAA